MCDKCNDECSACGHNLCGICELARNQVDVIVNNCTGHEDYYPCPEFKHVEHFRCYGRYPFPICPYCKNVRPKEWVMEGDSGFIQCPVCFTWTSINFWIEENDLDADVADLRKRLSDLIKINGLPIDVLPVQEIVDKPKFLKDGFELLKLLERF